MVRQNYNISISNRIAYRLLCLVILFIAATPSVQAQSVTLAWQANNPEPDTYCLFQRTSGEPYDYSDWIYQGSETIHTVYNLAPETTYFFVVRACNLEDQSVDSIELSYTTSLHPETDSNTIPDSGTDASIIIDNSDGESSPTGRWSISAGKNPYGENSLYSHDPGATYTFNSSLTGEIDVSLWWTEYPNRSTSVPVEIYDGNNLLDTVYVDQRVDGSQWNLLGRYSFSHAARVAVVSELYSGSTCADAAKFSMIASNTPDTTGGTDISTVIDNADSESHFTGTWKISGGKNPFGDDSQYSRKAGATYIFESSLTGALDVSLWWSEYHNRCNSVPILIYDGDEILDTVYVNQLNDGGQWNFLGGYLFKYSAEVMIISENDTCSTCADAVKIGQSN